jgi:hypothetical protein
MRQAAQPGDLIAHTGAHRHDMTDDPRGASRPYPPAPPRTARERAGIASDQLSQQIAADATQAARLQVQAGRLRPRPRSGRGAGSLTIFWLMYNPAGSVCVQNVHGCLHGVIRFAKPE